MKFRVVRDDGMILARDLELLAAIRTAADLSRHVPRHRYRIADDSGRTVDIRGK